MGRDKSSFSVSIHAPREGCDFCNLVEINAQKMFQFTHPGRGATQDSESGQYRGNVSIHAPREGCDRKTNLGT